LFRGILYIGVVVGVGVTVGVGVLVGYNVLVIEGVGVIVVVGVTVGVLVIVGVGDMVGVNDMVGVTDGVGGGVTGGTTLSLLEFAMDPCLIIRFKDKESLRNFTFSLCKSLLLGGLGIYSDFYGL
jgi:hypothetical protein